MFVDIYLIRNPIYYGDFLWKGVLYQGKHIPLISKELWERVQNKFNNNRSRSHKRKKHHFLFSGLMRCNCGCLITAEINNNKYIYIIIVQDIKASMGII